MSCEKSGLTIIKNDKLNIYYQNLIKVYDENTNSIEKIIDFPKYIPTPSLVDFLSRYELVKLISGIPGDIFEMGVCGGRGIFSFYHSLSLLEGSYELREVIGFDTFKGIQGVSEKDKNIYREVNNGEFAFSDKEQLENIANIHESFKDNWFNKKRIHLVEGDVMDTLPKYLETNKHKLVSLLYLDMDIYTPTKFAIKTVLPRMAKGSIIAFDELYYRSFPGETTALLDTLDIKQYKINTLFNSRINYIVI